VTEKTPLYDMHVAAGAKMVNFAGFEMPVQYIGLRQEHLNVRKNVGLFDVSHMGEIRIKGDRALETVDWLTTNYAARLENGQAQYSLLANENGGLVDDLIVYCVEKGREYFLCVNAANKDKDYAWMLEHNKGAKIVDESPFWGQIAVQGPKAMALVANVFGSEVMQIPSFYFAKISFENSKCIVARTGYTGEDGCEIFVSSEKTKPLWQEFTEKGQSLGAQPIGLGARDTLRTEMKYSLYGHEIDQDTNPYAAGLGWVVKPQFKDFLGKTEIVRQKEQGLSQKLIGFKMKDRGIPRHGYKILSLDGKEIGRVTSGTLSPSLNDAIGIAYVDQLSAEIGTELLIQIRQRQIKAEVVKTPFVAPGGN